MQYLSNHDDANDDPSKELFGIYQAFVQEAMGSYRSAIESIADASFSTFSTATAQAPRWVKRMTDLKAPARPLSTALRIANAKAAAAPGRLHRTCIGLLCHYLPTPISTDTSSDAPPSPTLSVGSNGSFASSSAASSKFSRSDGKSSAVGGGSIGDYRYRK